MDPGLGDVSDPRQRGPARAGRVHGELGLGPHPIPLSLPLKLTRF